jgi:hypothetical protein
MPERRNVKSRRFKAHTYFPAIDHQGDFIMSDRRNLTTRRICDISFDDVDIPTMFLDINKQM